MIGRNCYRVTENIVVSKKTRLRNFGQSTTKFSTMVIPGHRRFCEITGVEISMTSDWSISANERP